MATRNLSAGFPRTLFGLFLPCPIYSLLFDRSFIGSIPKKRMI